ncbi:helix-turn-helix domain-containing protein [Kribbella sp. DT2]|uniref:helix-turn-helix domain-containing protein n=1 Tax=Kribbella sp. DT2 TaxID=3393427 RepID=UPI003CF3B6E2
MKEPIEQSGPTALRMILGANLRRLRERLGVSRADAGWAIRASESKISRMELGRVSFKERDIRDLLTLYEVDDEAERAELISLAVAANDPGWWQRYDQVTPTWFYSYLGLEAAASLIRTFELQFVPGLLQTADYAREVVQMEDVPLPQQEIEQKVALRLDRQKILARSTRPRLWAVLDEAILRRPIGSRAVLRGQLESLLDSTRELYTTIQVLPFDSGRHRATAGAFSVLRFSDAELPDIAYVEHLTSALYLDKPHDVEKYSVAMDTLTVAAPPPKESERLILDALKDLS